MNGEDAWRELAVRIASYIRLRLGARADAAEVSELTQTCIGRLVDPRDVPRAISVAAELVRARRRGEGRLALIELRARIRGDPAAVAVLETMLGMRSATGRYSERELNAARRRLLRHIEAIGRRRR